MLTPLLGHVGPSRLTGHPPQPSHGWRWAPEAASLLCAFPCCGSFFLPFSSRSSLFFFLLVCLASPFLFSLLISLCSPFPPPLIFPSDLCGSPRPAQSCLGSDSQQDGQHPGTSLACSSQGCPASVHLLPLPWCFFFFFPLVFLILDPGPERTPEKKVGLSEVSPQCRRDCLPAG